MAGSRYLEKSKNGHILARNRPILMKFDRMTQIWSLKRTIVKELKLLKSKMAAADTFENS